MSDLKTILQQAVPDYAAARQQKGNYRQHPLRTDGAHNDEPLVDIADYGLAGQSYYSRPNGATGKPVPGVDSRVWLRQSIVERLSRLNYAIQNSAEVSQLLGGPVELYINEGWRSPQLQQRLYEEVFPELIRQQQPELDKTAVLARRDELVSEPPRANSPSPHATGAAIDVRLRYQQPDLQFVPGSEVVMGQPTDTTQGVNPDYYEQLAKLSKDDKLAQKNRRIFYWIMRGALLEDDSGFAVNPTEWWHWSYGDQLWAELTHAPEAFFGFAAQPE